MNNFENEFLEILQDKYSVSLKESSTRQQYNALAIWTKKQYSKSWIDTNMQYKKNKRKQVYYFSIEFLPGRMLSNNLLNLGLLEDVKNEISKMGLDYTKISLKEPEPALGNGGLGRLASCFQDSMASTSIAGHGNGIRYKYGLFKQKFIDGYQIELADDWLREENVWEARRRDRSVLVHFNGQVSYSKAEDGHIDVSYHNTQNVLAVPYDTAQVGYDNEIVNNLRLWSAEIPEEDEDKFVTYAEREEIFNISRGLYPDDSTYEGRILRLKQSYFFSSAGVQSVIRTFKKLNKDIRELPKYVAIHINDTHPALAIVELMRILLDEERLSWTEAWDITVRTTSYTNHTVLQEAMEKWPVHMIEELLPRIYDIIKEINRRHIDLVIHTHGEALAYKTAIIEHGLVHMAHLSILASHSVNGVAKLHTDILMNDTLHDFYLLSPEKFNNKTNGVTFRRWMYLSNPELVKIIDDKIGTGWKKDPFELENLLNYIDDKSFLDELYKVKQIKKSQFAEYVKSEYNLSLNEEAIFDVQIKRLHAYKRQLLQLLHIIDRYQRIKADPTLKLVPRVFIFGAKAAPSYYYAKDIIKLINEVAKLVNDDPTVSKYMQVLFTENYSVSLAEMIIPAANISEQISTAGKEASGTSNMKLMANGALTMATLDGANVEINQSVTDEHMFLFGLREHEVKAYNTSRTYNPIKLYESNQTIKRILDALIDGTIPNITNEGRIIYDSLLKYGDEYFVIADLIDYLHIQTEADKKYSDKYEWLQSSLINIAKSGRFSSDNTIKKYAEEIWEVEYD